MNTDTEFEQFYKLFPRHEAKKDALKAWGQTQTVRPSTTELLAALERAKASDQWRRGYIPLPASWLRGERWTDELKPAAPSAIDRLSDHANH